MYIPRNTTEGMGSIELHTLNHLGHVVDNDVLCIYHETLLKEWAPLNYEAQCMRGIYRPPNANANMLIPDRPNGINESMMKH